MSTRNPKTLMTVNNEDHYDYLFKIVLIGDCGTGKTCIVQRLTSGNFIERHGNTIGVDFSMKTLVIENKRVKLQIWDTAGQERFRTITQSYYRSANGVIIVYDVTRKTSFASLEKWVEEVRKYTSSKVIVSLIGNKCDLDSQREVESDEPLAFTHYCPEIMFVMETSAKDNTNVEGAFRNMAIELMKQHDAHENQAATNEAIQLGEGTSISKCSC